MVGTLRIDILRPIFEKAVLHFYILQVLAVICPETQRIDELGVYFGGCTPNFLSQKLVNVARSVCKTYGDREQTRRFLQPPLSVFFVDPVRCICPIFQGNRLFIEFLGKSQLKPVKCKSAKLLFRK